MRKSVCLLSKRTFHTHGLSKAKTGEAPVKSLLFTIAIGVLANMIYGFMCGILPPVSEPARVLLGETFWKLPVPVVGTASVFLIILGITIALYTNTKKFIGKTKKILPVIAGITGLLGLTGLTTAVAAYNVTSIAPFKRIVMADNNPISESVVLTRNMSSLWLRIDGGPMNDDPESVSLELRRRPPSATDGELLDISELKKDESLSPGNFYFPRQGRFKVPGPFMAGDKLMFRTGNGWGFEGRIIFEFWGTPE